MSDALVSVALVVGIVVVAYLLLRRRRARKPHDLRNTFSFYGGPRESGHAYSTEEWESTAQAGLKASRARRGRDGDAP